jgi:hypothetical protein
MIELRSNIEGNKFSLIELEEALKPLGYTIGGGWEYDHGSFDYKIDDKDGYMFLRIPFQAIDGALDQKGVLVEIREPYLLNHKYQAGLDEGAKVTNVNALVNQFQEPVDKDSDVPEEYIKTGEELLKEVEQRLRLNDE